MLVAVLEQSLLFLPLALGVYISYGVLKIPDLTTDGSFVLGAALFAVFVHAGIPPLGALAIACLGGALCGICVSVLQNMLRLNPLIAGILLVFILNTLTLKIMGKPNLSLFETPCLFTQPTQFVVIGMIGIALLLAISYLLASRTGIFLYALGNNPLLLSLSGRRAHLYQMLGLGISNALSGSSGAIMAQASGYADSSMGMGIVLIALGTVIIGKQLETFLFHKRGAKCVSLFCCFLGVLLYFLCVQCLLALGVDPIYLRLMIGILLIGFLTLSQQRKVAA